MAKSDHRGRSRIKLQGEQRRLTTYPAIDDNCRMFFYLFQQTDTQSWSEIAYEEKCGIQLWLYIFPSACLAAAAACLNVTLILNCGLVLS